MASSARIALKAVLGVLSAILLLICVSAGPASAHAELVSSTPPQGARLDKAPAVITLTFTEDVNLLLDGVRLVDARGGTVPTPTPTTKGHTVRWSMPPELPNGGYVVNWRVVSADGHPVSGAFSFGVGAGVRPLVSDSGDVTDGLPWPVAGSRFVGYVGFALLAGVFAFITFCSSSSRGDLTLRLLARIGLLMSVGATAAAFLLQGPYAAGVVWTRVLDPVVVHQTTATRFGAILLWRGLLYGALFFGCWSIEALGHWASRWAVGVGLTAVAFTFAAAGHGAASGRPLDLAVDTVHALAASVWVGGLIVLVVLGRAVEQRAVRQFSRLAMSSVIVLLASGVLNALSRVSQPPQLWQTRYGVLLSVKVLVVGGAIAAASVSRRRLRAGHTPYRSVGIEAAATVVVLAVTSVLTLTAPPATVTATSNRPGAIRPSVQTTATVRLAHGDVALITFHPASTAGSTIRLVFEDSARRRVTFSRVSLAVSLPERQINTIHIPLTHHRDSEWKGRYQFPLPGIWKVTVTTEDQDQLATMSDGSVLVSK